MKIEIYINDMRKLTITQDAISYDGVNSKEIGESEEELPRAFNFFFGHRNEIVKTYCYGDPSRENGDIADFSLEELYQVFKARFLEETRRKESE